MSRSVCGPRCELERAGQTGEWCRRQDRAYEGGEAWHADVAAVIAGAVSARGRLGRAGSAASEAGSLSGNWVAVSDGPQWARGITAAGWEPSTGLPGRSGSFEQRWGGRRDYNDGLKPKIVGCWEPD